MACIGWSDGICGGSDVTDPSAAWGCFGTPITGADGTAIGDGQQNSIDIVGECAAAGIAARLAFDLTLGGQSDWFSPSKDELNALCKWAFNDTVNASCNNGGFGGLSLTSGGFSTGYYWSSSELDNNSAWVRDFYYGYQGSGGKFISFFVRPVRAF